MSRFLFSCVVTCNDNQKPEDYTDDYSQGFNDYYDQNLLL